MLKPLVINFEKMVNEKLARLNKNVDIEVAHDDLINLYLEVKRFCAASLNDIASLIADRVDSSWGMTISSK